MVEQAPTFRTGGNGVDVSGQAIAVARQICILASINAARADVAGIAFVDATGRPLARVEVRGPIDDVEIVHGDLVGILHRTVGDRAEHVFGDSVTALEQDECAVTVRFTHESPRRYDPVVGADGIHSAIRRFAFGPDRQFLRYLGYFGAFADADPQLAEDRWITTYNEPGRMAGIHRSGRHSGERQISCSTEANSWATTQTRHSARICSVLLPPEWVGGSPI